MSCWGLSLPASRFTNGAGTMLQWETQLAAASLRVTEDFPSAWVAEETRLILLLNIPADNSRLLPSFPLVPWAGSSLLL